MISFTEASSQTKLSDEIVLERIEPNFEPHLTKQEKESFGLVIMQQYKTDGKRIR